jgi:hypothetical protein
MRFQLGSTEVFATAWRVDTSALLSATIYADPQCARQLPYGTITVQSGSCTYSQLLFNSVVAAQLDARDSPKTERIAFGLNCNQQCGFCSVYNRTAADLCTPVCTYCSTTAQPSLATSLTVFFFLWFRAVNVYMKIKTVHF